MIASECGFCDCAKFHKHFPNVIGNTNLLKRKIIPYSAHPAFPYSYGLTIEICIEAATATAAFNHFVNIFVLREYKFYLDLHMRLARTRRAAHTRC